jgi:hypothetical protein
MKNPRMSRLIVGIGAVGLLGCAATPAKTKQPAFVCREHAESLVYSGRVENALHLSFDTGGGEFDGLVFIPKSKGAGIVVYVNKNDPLEKSLVQNKAYLLSLKQADCFDDSGVFFNNVSITAESGRWN